MSPVASSKWWSDCFLLCLIDWVLVFIEVDGGSDATPTRIWLCSSGWFPAVLSFLVVFSCHCCCPCCLELTDVSWMSVGGMIMMMSISLVILLLLSSFIIESSFRMLWEIMMPFEGDTLLLSMISCLLAWSSQSIWGAFFSKLVSFPKNNFFSCPTSFRDVSWCFLSRPSSCCSCSFISKCRDQYPRLTLTISCISFVLSFFPAFPDATEFPDSEGCKTRLFVVCKAIKGGKDGLVSPTLIEINSRRHKKNNHDVRRGPKDK